MFGLDSFWWSMQGLDELRIHISCSVQICMYMYIHMYIDSMLGASRLRNPEFTSLESSSEVARHRQEHRLRTVLTIYTGVGSGSIKNSKAVSGHDIPWVSSSPK